MKLVKISVSPVAKPLSYKVFSLLFPLFDYNNDIPVGAITLTDRYGNKLPNQTAQGNNGQMEYFTLDGHYKVLERDGSAVKVQIGGEPVWLQASFAE